MNSIVKIFTGHHIDLSKIISISEVEIVYDNRPRCVKFQIEYQLRDEPVVYSKDLKVRFDTRDTCGFEMLDGTFKTEYDAAFYNQDVLIKIVDVVDYKENVDKLIKQWIDYKDGKLPIELNSEITSPK